jgi:hypothetical protein
VESEERERLQRRKGSRAESNVVRLPRDWLGPRDELVPFGPSAERRLAEARAREEAAVETPATVPDARVLDLPVKPPVTTDDFWGGELDSIPRPVVGPRHVEEPAHEGSDDPVAFADPEADAGAPEFHEVESAPIDALSTPRPAGRLARRSVAVGAAALAALAGGAVAVGALGGGAPDAAHQAVTAASAIGSHSTSMIIGAPRHGTTVPAAASATPPPHRLVRRSHREAPARAQHAKSRHAATASSRPSVTFAATHTGISGSGSSATGSYRATSATGSADRGTSAVSSSSVTYRSAPATSTVTRSASSSSSSSSGAKAGPVGPGAAFGPGQLG